MIQNEKNRDLKQKPLLLFSPLDWGLGHTTRSIPILRAFQECGWQIVVACDSIQKNLLEQEVDDLRFLFLQGYNVSYSSRGGLTGLKILLQLNKILMQIKSERRWLHSFLEESPVQAVLSDNRYGFYHSGLPCIFVTHQLQPHTGWGHIADRLLQTILYRFIKRFTFCWVPDNEGEPRIAGDLAHPVLKPPIPVAYIGSLSRFDYLAPSRFDYRLLVVISGPEPQRSVFEKLVWRELQKLGEDEPDKKYVIVRGLPGVNGGYSYLRQVTCYDHLDSGKLGELITRSEFVLCRSGYTSLMELLHLKKKMILVPTPGQPEQEYLADYYQKKRYAVVFSQNRFSLTEALKAAQEFSYTVPEFDTGVYRKVISTFSSSLVLNDPDR